MKSGSLSARGMKSSVSMYATSTTPSGGANIRAHASRGSGHQRTHSLTSQFGGSTLQSPSNLMQSPSNYNRGAGPEKHAKFHTVGGMGGGASQSTGTKKSLHSAQHANHAPSDIPLTEIHASASLQLILFFNIFYSLSHFLFHVTCFIVRLSTAGGATQAGYSVIGLIIHIVLLIVTAAGEFLRLAAGFFGNMRERVPRLAAFMVLSAFMLPIQLGFVIGVRTVSLLELVSGILLLIFIILELLLGSFAIWKVVKVSSRRYHLQFNSDGTLYEEAEEGASGFGSNETMYMDEVETMERPSTAMSTDRPGTAMSAGTEYGLSRPSSRSNVRMTPTASGGMSARGGGFFGSPMPGGTQGGTNRNPNIITLSSATPSKSFRDRIREKTRLQEKFKFNVQQPSPESDDEG
eukprot:CAMPEP_0117444700 /NCGR_PEP_ID=MMETSP0759-20121206/5385_1 /TAXON_ID=63605 /ORGANISM="Percolomonas cosmopolitus, Strain WS" /LENGTH=405 /DNA_ID=CAMNT_0005236793 /DNA_START=131 /DNA_END=1348 /DNA_ORIENTATION=+